MTGARTTTRHTIDGYGFVVRTSGRASGPVHLLLHGIGLSARSYNRLAKRLEPTGRVITLDLPGFGAARTPLRRLSVEDYARLLHVLMQRLNVERCVVVGHSMGAQFALELARQQPELVSHLVLVGPVVDDRRSSAVRQGLALARDSAREPLGTNLLVFTDYARCGLRWYLTELPAMLNYPTLEKMSGLGVPVLIARGARDPIASESWCRRLLAAAGGGAQLTIPRHRHVIIHSAPGRLAAAITVFAQRPSTVGLR